MQSKFFGGGYDEINEKSYITYGEVWEIHTNIETNKIFLNKQWAEEAIRVM